MHAFAKLGHHATFYDVDNNVGIRTPIPNFNIVAANAPNCTPIDDYHTVLWVSHPVSAQKYLRQYPHHIYVFDAIDLPSGEFTTWADNYDLISQYADVVFATARDIYKLNRQHNEQVYMLPNAADYEFISTPQPISPVLKPIAELGRPIVMYIGAVATWLDWPLVNQVAQTCSDYEFVFVGAFYGTSPRQLPQQPNIHYLDQQPYHNLPQFTHHADAFINPFQVNEMTNGVDPIKIYEYMSVGKPIISTPISELYKFSDCVYLAANAADFASHLQRAITTPNIHYDRYHEIARENSWMHRAKYAVSILDELTPQGYKQYNFKTRTVAKQAKKPISYAKPNWRRIWLQPFWHGGRTIPVSLSN